MLNLNSITLFSDKPKTLVSFYQKIFESEPVWSEGEFDGFDVGTGTLIIGPHSKVY